MKKKEFYYDILRSFSSLKILKYLILLYYYFSDTNFYSENFTPTTSLQIKLIILKILPILFFVIISLFTTKFKVSKRLILIILISAILFYFLDTKYLFYFIDNNIYRTITALGFFIITYIYISMNKKSGNATN